MNRVNTILKVETPGALPREERSWKGRALKKGKSACPAMANVSEVDVLTETVAMCCFANA